MRNYLIIVEGAHDIAVMEKLLRLNGVNEQIHELEKVPLVWKRTIPARFPFREGRLERITPIPSFLMNEEVSVAIKCANGDTEIMRVLQQIMNAMQISEKDQLSGIMLLCDADQEKAESKIGKVTGTYSEKEDFKLGRKQGMLVLDTGMKEIPVFSYVFPDNENEGDLEKLLLETAKAAYPGLLKIAEEYVAKASDICKGLKKEQYARKATVGCIANAMKPGKANQVSIADDRWVSEETLKACHMLQKLNAELCSMLQLT